MRCRGHGEEDATRRSMRILHRHVASSSLRREAVEAHGKHVKTAATQAARSGNGHILGSWNEA